MKHIYEQPELNKMEYAVEAFANGSGYDAPALLDARDNDTTLNWF